LSVEDEQRSAGRFFGQSHGPPLQQSRDKVQHLSTELKTAFDLQPNLKGELIELRPLRPEDWDDLFAVASDPLIWEQHPESDRYKQDVFKVFFSEALECGGAFAIIDKKSQQIIGSS